MVGAVLSYASYKTIGLDVIKQLRDNPDKLAWAKHDLSIAKPYGLYLKAINYGDSGE